MNKPLVIDYYSDILCVWAWIAQRRLDELVSTLGADITVQYHYVDVFGDVPTKMATQWQPKGGYEGFAEHVRESAATFEDAPVNSKLWREVQPATSANAHLVLKAVELVCGKEESIRMALNVRKAFFVDALDIGCLGTLYRLCDAAGLAPVQLAAVLDDGSAMAALMQDYQRAKQQNIKGSPCYIMDGGRQTLFGNVGYRVLLANVQELLKHSVGEASWC